MSPDRPDDDVLDLTEDMAAEDDGGAADPEAERSASEPPPKPRVSSPFTLLAEPRRRAETRESDAPAAPAKEKRPSRTSFIPSASPGDADAVVARPIKAVEIRAAERVEAAESVVEEEPPADDILDLGQDYMMGSGEGEGEGADDAEPVPLVRESRPPSAEAVEDDEAEAGEGLEVAVEEDGGGALDAGSPEAVFDEVEEEAEELSGEDLAEAEVEAEGPAAGIPEAEGEEIDLAEVEDLTPAMIPIPIQGRTLVQDRKPKMRRRKRGRGEWWAQIFDDDYFALLPEYSKRDTRREVEFLENSLGVPTGSLVLDLACGHGRHAVALARRNYRIVGVDLSLSMLARAGELAQEAGQKINFIHGDMRDLQFDSTFDAAYCTGTSFGYFDEATNAKVIEGVYRALKPGAPFLLELANRDYVVTQQPNLLWFEGSGAVCMEETDFNYINSRLYVSRQIILGNGERQVRHELSVRLYSLHEIGNLLHNLGFAVSTVSGHRATAGSFFGAASTHLIIVAEKRR